MKVLYTKATLKNFTRLREKHLRWNPSFSKAGDTGQLFYLIYRTQSQVFSFELSENFQDIFPLEHF